MNRIRACIVMAAVGSLFSFTPASAFSVASDMSSSQQAAQQATSSSSVSQSAAPTKNVREWVPPAAYSTDIVIGKAEAPVTIIEYASLTCPHCAAFENQKLPELKKEWIDSGKVRLVFRHFPIDMAAMGAAALVSCLPAEDRLSAVEALYKDVNVWATKPLAESIPSVMSQALGRKLDYKTDFDACVQDPSLQKNVLQPAFDASKGGVSGTPTFFINGEVLVGFSEAQPRQIDDIIVKKLGQASGN